MLDQNFLKEELSLEVWKDISGYEGIYQVSNIGRVKSLKRNTKNQHGKKEVILKQRKNRDGYLRVNLKKNGKMSVQTIHRLVGAAFLENTTKEIVVNHIDGDKTNNRAENLEWCSYSENTIHAYKNHLAQAGKGESAGNAKLNEANVFTIYHLYFIDKETTTTIAKTFDVSRRCIEKIVQGDTWKHLAKKWGI